MLRVVLQILTRFHLIMFLFFGVKFDSVVPASKTDIMEQVTNWIVLALKTAGFIVQKLRLHTEENRFSSQMVCLKHCPNLAPSRSSAS